jgi:hypothetical protein
MATRSACIDKDSDGNSGARARLRLAEVRSASGAVRLDIGRVVERRDRGWCVATAGDDVLARRAPSCLIEPAEGDEVLLCRRDETIWVIAVLAHAEQPNPSRIVVEGDLQIRAGGRVSVGSGAGIDLTAASDVSVVAGRFDVNAVETSMVSDRLTLALRWMQAEVEHVRVVAGSVETAAERLVQRLQRSYRFVEDLDQLRARYLDWAADRTARVRAENVGVFAREVAKVDGEQIHIG